MSRKTSNSNLTIAAYWTIPFYKSLWKRDSQGYLRLAFPEPFYEARMKDSIGNMKRDLEDFLSEEENLETAKRKEWNAASDCLRSFPHAKAFLKTRFDIAWLKTEIAFSQGMIEILNLKLARIEDFDRQCRDAYAANVWKDAEALWAASKLPNGMGYSDRGMKALEDAALQAGGKPDPDSPVFEYENVKAAFEAFADAWEKRD